MYYTKKRLSQLGTGETFRLAPKPGQPEWRVLNFRDDSKHYITHDPSVVPTALVGAEEEGHVDYHWADATVYVVGDRRQEDIGRWVEMPARDIPLGAEYTPFGARPEVGYKPLTCYDRDFITANENATRWVRMPDRRQA